MCSFPANRLLVLLVGMFPVLQGDQLMGDHGIVVLSNVVKRGSCGGILADDRRSGSGTDRRPSGEVGGGPRLHLVCCALLPSLVLISDNGRGQRQRQRQRQR